MMHLGPTLMTLERRAGDECLPFVSNLDALHAAVDTNVTQVMVDAMGHEARPAPWSEPEEVDATRRLAASGHDLDPLHMEVLALQSNTRTLWFIFTVGGFIYLVFSCGRR